MNDKLSDLIEYRSTEEKVIRRLKRSIKDIDSYLKNPKGSKQTFLFQFTCDPSDLPKILERQKELLYQQIARTQKKFNQYDRYIKKIERK